MKKEVTAEQMQKKSISLFTIIEILILIIGVIMSLSSYIKVLRYTSKYIWCFVFPLIGIGLIAFLILKIRKKRIWIRGILFIILYLYVGGYGAFICEINASRIKKVQFYEDKQVIAVMDGITYSWDHKSVTYNSTDLEYVESTKDVAISVGGETKRYDVYKDGNSSNIYIEIYSGGTGIYLKLSPEK